MRPSENLSTGTKIAQIDEICADREIAGVNRLPVITGEKRLHLSTVSRSPDSTTLPRREAAKFSEICVVNVQLLYAARRIANALA